MSKASYAAQPIAASYRAGATLVRIILGFCFANALTAAAQSTEVYREEAMPPGFTVQVSELEGPVFADAQGRTLYIWPLHKLRNGYSGEPAGAPRCYDDVITVTAGLMSPYPPGIALPDLEQRLSCTALWPPVYAPESAQSVGKWTLVERSDGTRQWAYDDQPLYTSVRDREPGDTYGGTGRKRDGDSPAVRVPARPPALVPPGFAVATVSTGRLLTTDTNASVYAFAKDSAAAAACTENCLLDWDPVLAPVMAQARGEWALLERSPGLRQWVYRGSPLYTYKHDPAGWSQTGSDIPGWTNVYTQRAPAFPASFTVQSTLAGQVLADEQGRTIYTYQCGEDSAHQLACDHPLDTQVYRLAMCGAGDPQKCLKHWPYVLAADNASSSSRAWSVMHIDSASGRVTAAATEGALRVWAYRDRPVYTFARDQRPGDVHGGGTGEWRGKRNGLFAFWLRDDYMKKTL
ncbi:MAG: hypothetical protein AB8B57_14930 [Congregibacter sp.]